MRKMFNHFKFLVLGSALALLVGCAGSGSTASNLPSEFDGAPSWVVMGGSAIEGAVAATGSAPRNAGNDLSFQRQEAMADARDNLSRQLAVKVQNMFKSFKASTGTAEDGSYDRASESVSRQISNNTISGSKLRDAWFSKSGTMYVLVVIDTETIAKEMENQLKNNSSLGNKKAIYQKFLADKAQGELDKALEEFTPKDEM